VARTARERQHSPCSRALRRHRMTMPRSLSTLHMVPCPRPNLQTTHAFTLVVSVLCQELARYLFVLAYARYVCCVSCIVAVRSFSVTRMCKQEIRQASLLPCFNFGYERLLRC
jgi:hypothetical protein